MRQKPRQHELQKLKDEVVRLHKEGKTQTEIGDTLGFSRKQVNTAFAHLGLMKHRGPNTDKMAKAQLNDLKVAVIELFNRGFGATGIMKELGLVGRSFKKGQVGRFLNELSLHRSLAEAMPLAVLHRTRKEKLCKHCKRPFTPLSGKKTYCPECDGRLMWKFGITRREFAELVEAQDGLCPICDVELDTLPATQVVVDHCHKTGAVRGVPCNSCNIKLGSVEDPVWLARALVYLKSFTETS